MNSIEIIAAFGFYSLMFFLYLYSSGKYKKHQNQERYVAWVTTRGGKVKRSIVVIVIIYTCAQLIILLS